MLHTERINPATLTAAEKCLLLDNLCVVNKQVFAGETKEELERYAINSKANLTEIVLLKDREKIAGFFIARYFERSIRKPAVTYMSIRIGMLPAYRGQHYMIRLWLRCVIRYWFTAHFPRMFFFNIVLHPSSYCLLTTYFPVVWPSVAQRVPPAIEKLLTELAEELELERVDEDNPFVYHHHLQTIDSQRSRELASQTPNPHIRFFVENNPDYAKGHGMLTLLPITWAAVVTVIARVIKHRIRRQWEQWVMGNWDFVLD